METVGAVVQTQKTWGHADVVLHADGEPATKSLGKAIANAMVHKTLPSMGRPTVTEARGRAGRSLHRGLQVGSGGENRLRFTVEASRDRVADPTRCLAHDQVQHWTRRVLSLQEDLRQAIRRAAFASLVSRCASS